MLRAVLFILLGISFMVSGACLQGWWILLVWFGFSFLWLGFAHGTGWHRALGKRPDGTIPVWSKLLHFPFLAYTWLVWHILRLLRRGAARSIVNEQLVIGRRLLGSEFQEQYVNYIDLTAEFQEPAAIRRQRGYVCFPILDASAPGLEALRLAIAQLRPGKTYIHCAAGYGRTGLFAVALLLTNGTVKNIEEGLQLLRQVRPGIRLNAIQRRCIEEFSNTLDQAKQPFD